MMHLRNFPTSCSKLLLKAYKSSPLRSKLFVVLLKPECTSRPIQVIRFLNVEQTLSEPVTKADDTNREVTKTLSTSTENLDTDINMGGIRGGDLNKGDNSSKMRMAMSIQNLRKFLKEAGTLNLNLAMITMNKLCKLLGTRYFPVLGISRYKNVESLISPIELKEVFEVIERNLRILNLTSLKTTLEVCTIFKMSMNTPLMQNLIELISVNINSMSPVQVVHIYCIIENYYSRKDPKIAALLDACKDFFKNDFESQTHSWSEPEKMSRYVSYKKLPVNVREKLIMKVFENKSNLYLWSYANILEGLVMPGVIENHKVHKQYVDDLIKEVTKILDGYYLPSELLYLIQKHTWGILNRRVPYNEDFMDRLGLKVAECKPTLKIAIESFLPFIRVSHFSSSLFHYIVSKTENVLNSEEFKTLTPVDFCKLTKILSIAGKQTKIMSYFFRGKLETACSFFPGLEANHKIQVPFDLAVLGIYEDRLLERCFTSENGGALTGEDIKGLSDFTKNMLLLLHQAVVTFHPSYEKPLLSDELVKELASNNHVVLETHNIWQEVVDSCFGGPNFVMKNCTTPLHHNLSYVVFLDKNNAPIDTTSILETNTQDTDKPINITNLSISDETKVIVIQDVWTEGQVTFRNIPSWKGHFQLYLDVLEVYCSGVIPLLISEFKSLKSSQRVPFLLSKIEKKFGVLSQPKFFETIKS